MIEGAKRRLGDNRNRPRELTRDQMLAELGEARGLMQGALHRVVDAIGYLPASAVVTLQGLAWRIRAGLSVLPMTF
jgi:hypothetical protein